jgi:hypothetical protein
MPPSFDREGRDTVEKQIGSTDRGLLHQKVENDLSARLVDPSRQLMDAGAIDVSEMWIIATGPVFRK